MKSWIVYLDGNDKLDAEEDNHVDTEKKLLRQGFIIKGYPAAKKKSDAIWYISNYVPMRPVRRKKWKRK